MDRRLAPFAVVGHQLGSTALEPPSTVAPDGNVASLRRWPGPTGRGIEQVLAALLLHQEATPALAEARDRPATGRRREPPVDDAVRGDVDDRGSVVGRGPDATGGRPAYREPVTDDRGVDARQVATGERSAALAVKVDRVADPQHDQHCRDDQDDVPADRGPLSSYSTHRHPPRVDRADGPLRSGGRPRMLVASPAVVMSRSFGFVLSPSAPAGGDELVIGPSSSGATRRPTWVLTLGGSTR